MLAALLATRGSGRGPGRLLVTAVAGQVAWSAVLALTLTTWALPAALVVSAESLRPTLWTAFLLVLLGIGGGPEATRRLSGPALALGGASVAAAALHAWSGVTGASAQARLGGALVGAVVVLAAVEQLYRNTPEHRRWAVKFVTLAVAGLFAYDLVLYADALLFQALDYRLWAARGYANALVVPLVAVAAARTPDWRLDIQVSRHVVFHSATLLASGLFLLAVSAIGYGLRLFGGAWAGVLQVLLAFAALLAVVALAASGSLRARLRVLLAKHFFSYRYDYRTEWLRLTELMTRPERPNSPADSLSHRALVALGGLVESQAGALWLRGDDGSWRCDAHRGLPPRPPLRPDDALVRFLEATGWLVEVPEWRAHPEHYRDLVLPPWLADDAQAWLVVPLVLHERLNGIVQLQRPAAPAAVDWEVRDVLKTAGRQVAGYLAVRRAVEDLVEARQFASFNRMSAFVVHDLKNLVAQLSLLLKNATRHRDNPEFQRDMLETVENVLERIQGLLLQLRVGTRPIEPAAPLALGPALRAAVAAKKGSHVEPTLEIDDDAERADVVAHRDRFERVIGHLVQNAVEATPAGGRVCVRAACANGSAVVEVRDSGHGMSREFVDTRLFRPFHSTKEHGMGIGSFESREYLREIGGSLSVDSVEGRGTTFTLRLPLRATAEAARER